MAMVVEFAMNVGGKAWWDFYHIMARLRLALFPNSSFEFSGILHVTHQKFNF